jgi:hypothetical protein
VGLLAREIEAAGITTVGLSLVKEIADKVRAPRLLHLRWPFGHALGEPGAQLQQRTILHDMLTMAQGAPRPGLVLELPYRWRREAYPPITDWDTPSPAFSAALHDTPGRTKLANKHRHNAPHPHLTPPGNS